MTIRQRCVVIRLRDVELGLRFGAGERNLGGMHAGFGGLRLPGNAATGKQRL